MRRWPVITMGVAALAVGGLGATLERGAAAPTIATDRLKTSTP